jgi:hypothetical protein
MTEMQMCEFVERWNQVAEERIGFWRDVYPSNNIKVDDLIETETITNMLEALMAQHDADAPKWIEVSAMAADGSIYWARESGLHAAEKAQERAIYLAQCRSAKEA